MDQRTARAVMEVTASPAWKVVEEHMLARRERVRDELEKVSSETFRFEQGRASELRFFLAMRRTAEAVLSPKTPQGTL